MTTLRFRVLLVAAVAVFGATSCALLSKSAPIKPRYFSPERPGDVPALVDHFLAKHRRLRPDAPLRGVSPEALELLRAYRWPGNVRELEHASERAVVLADGPTVQESDLPDDVRAAPGRAAPVPQMGADLSVKRAFRSLEEQLIREALERTGGNRTRAADLLDLSYRALLYKIKEYGIEA